MFKAVIKNMDQIIWKHSGHKNWVSCLKLSSNQKYILGGGNDQKVILSSSENGSILQSMKTKDGSLGLIGVHLE